MYWRLVSAFMWGLLAIPLLAEFPSRQARRAGPLGVAARARWPSPSRRPSRRAHSRQGPASTTCNEAIAIFIT
ncbi:hypothetical protein [Massilia phosphatilytica]